MLAHAEHDRDRIRYQPPESEQQGISGRTVDPMGIVDNDQQRLYFSRRRQQAQGGGPHGEPVLGTGRAQRQGTLQGGGLRLRDPSERPQSRAKKFEKSGEGDLSLGLPSAPP